MRKPLPHNCTLVVLASLEHVWTSMSAKWEGIFYKACGASLGGLAGAFW